MKKKGLNNLILVLLMTSCNNANKTSTEVIQKHRDKIVSVSDQIIDIKSEILFGSSSLYIIDDILIVSEISPKGKRGIHLFNKNTFKYITSTGIMGEGPGEISTIGHLGIDKKNRTFLVPDVGKKLVYKFPLDSVLSNNRFKPTIGKRMKDDLFMERFNVLNDSVIIGRSWRVTTDHSFDMITTTLNIKNYNIEKLGYENPKAVGKKSCSFFSSSVEHDFYVNCYYYIDLITICSLSGNLEYNVYGPGWFDKEQKINAYFFGIEACKNQIYASYIGRNRINVKGNITKGSLPSKLIVFNEEGSYQKTIDTGYEFNQFCIDEDKNRIIVYFDNREEALGYFSIP